MLITDNYSEAVNLLMELAVNTNKPINPMPRLRTATLGKYAVGVDDKNNPIFKYQLSNLSEKQLSLDEIRQMESCIGNKILQN